MLYVILLIEDRYDNRNIDTGTDIDIGIDADIDRSIYLSSIKKQRLEPGENVTKYEQWFSLDYGQWVVTTFLFKLFYIFQMSISKHVLFLWKNNKTNSSSFFRVI